MSANAHCHHIIFHPPTTKGVNQIGMYLMMSLEIHKYEEDEDVLGNQDEADEDTEDDGDHGQAAQQMTISDTDSAKLWS